MADANSEINQVATFLKRFPNEMIRLDYLITGARVKAASGKDADISEALHFGFVVTSKRTRIRQLA